MDSSIKSSNQAENSPREIKPKSTTSALLLPEKNLKPPEGEKPSLLSLDEVIAGFREAVTMMPVGARWKILVPSDLAYGEVRRSDLIGPNQLLIFEIELVAMKPTESNESAE